MNESRRSMGHALALGVTWLALAATAAAAPPVAEPVETTAAEAGPEFPGRVRALGEPVAGATVRVLPEGLSMVSPNPATWVEPAVVRTDDAGRFAVDGVEGGKFVLRVETETHAPTGRVIELGAEPLEVALEPGHALGGRVLDASTRKPLEGARVLGCDANATVFGEAACPVAVTDENGVFAFEHLPGGRLTLQARAPGRAVSDALAIEIPLADDAEPIRFWLREGAAVSGLVVDGREQPLPRRIVGFQPQQTSLGAPARRGESWPWPVVTDTEGSFTHEGLPAGMRYTLYVRRGGNHPPFETDPVTIEAGKDIDDLRVVLEGPATVRVRLVTRDEDPIREVTAYLRGRDVERNPFGTPGKTVAGIRNDGEGHFTLELFEKGPHDLLLVPEGHAELERGIDLAPDTERDLGTLVVEPGSAVAGRISDADGAPVAGAEITATYSLDSGMRRRKTTSDDGGEYRVGGLGEKPVLLLQVAAEGYGDASRENIPSGDEAVDFTLAPTGGVRGVVESAGGDPPGPFLVKLHAEASDGTDMAGMIAGLSARPSSFDNEDGSFEVADVAPGRYTVEVRATDRVPARRAGIVVASGETTDAGSFVLEHGIRVRGRVLSAADGAPVLGADVSAQEKGGSIATMMQRMSEGRDAVATDEEGRFELNGLAAGSYTLTADHPDHAPASRTLELDADVPPDTVTLRLGRGGILRGTVRDGSGSPVSGGRVLVFESMFEMDRARTAVTDPDGNYEITKIPAGSYQAMRAPGEGGGSSFDLKTKTVVIREAGITVADFGEEPRIHLSGRVLRGGEAVADALLSFVPLTGGSFTDMTTTSSDSGGSYEVSLDLPGTYRVTVQTGAGLAAGSMGAITTQIDVPDESTQVRDILLRASGIAGQVLDEDGSPVGQATVSVLADGASASMWEQTGAVTDGDGRYRVEGLEDGIYRVTASAAGHRSQSIHPVEVGGGRRSDGVDFRLSRGVPLRGTLVDAQGRGLRGAFVLAAPSGTIGNQGIAQAMTDVNGSFSLTVPSDGPVDITAVAQGWAPVRRTGFVPSPDPEAPPIELRAGPGGRLRIQVLGPDDRPVADADIQVAAVPAFLGSEIGPLLSPPSRTDANGTSLVPYLAAGDYSVTVRGRGDAPPARTTVLEGAETNLVVRLP